MAVDQALLLSAEETSQVTLRFYRWETATLSLGYFQKLADREQHQGSVACPVVRRASGGGAIVHDRELTFSLTFPSENRWSKKNNDLYRSVHGCVVDALRTNPFLCFQRRTDGDIILDGHKVGGSAQRRSKNAILQHTSLLLQKSPAAQELAGIEELGGVVLDGAVLIDVLVQRLSEKLQLAFKPAELTFEQKEMTKRIVEETFGNSCWLERK